MYLNRYIQRVAGRSSLGPRLGCAFYRADVGHEPVRECLRELGKEVSKDSGSDILTGAVELACGQAPGRRSGRWAVRSSQHAPAKEYRVFFCIMSSTIVLLHGIAKKTRVTPRADLELARKRLTDVRVR